MIEWIEIEHPIEYSEAYKMMKARLTAILNGSASEAVFVLEHQDVYTAGISFKPDELLNNSDIPVYYTDRGGKFTYHGPGQVIIYPIINLSANGRLKDIRNYVNNLSLLVINSLKFFNITGITVKDAIGVWVNGKFGIQKIASIGVRIHRWVTYHGVAINVCSDLKKFKGIIPCGDYNASITSIRELLNQKVDLDYYKAILRQEFYKIFE
ncbi:lipoyl(octanoyl) transferase [Orientia chuto str. Dubai]|uniref:Octanoyltransferase n=1 Tax=Orientia chuto str. Dubai TaxID=1359168 RepID=A0A0F3MNQ2_9RICK|nr:lipoyl(octanoyl) transferase LipB [Candidatus Orientia mediorientalis]KJV57291.1 lipoyl(octanoyl) transferase [Orientia chuto str. Dubai]